MSVTPRSQECYNQIRWNSKILEFEIQFKFLGVFIDSRLQFNKHRECKGSKTSESIVVYYRVADFVPQSFLINMYSIIFLP